MISDASSPMDAAGGLSDEDMASPNDQDLDLPPDIAMDGHDDPISQPLAIPIGTWSILELNDTARSDVCHQQIDFCDEECGGSDQVSLNFCKEDTMEWGCNCKSKIPECAPYQWPVTVAECRGRETKCQEGCTDSVTQELCKDGCSEYFRCQRPGGPASQLRSESVNNASAASMHDDAHPSSAATTLLIQHQQILLSSSKIMIMTIVWVSIFIHY
ncbi:hypothetical protein O0I10_008702 [Lichtheimia ornata]|uniref:DUF7707 domain-containing protein n=1 Tax=Lichtheimia ornata TaxID=688661 RepID=A0AAD7UXY3_9FUNG|nr:uncharacterized protein O0I10_008702 [Lichtheimia ornata]KAJ8655614.1 hypothetical protein O0I10_008702 [Lichtheimia ornata]